MNRSDVWDAAYEDGFERGVEVGRADAVPPGVEPMPWCEEHDERYYVPYSKCAIGQLLTTSDCRREVKVKHWRTAE